MARRRNACLLVATVLALCLPAFLAGCSSGDDAIPPPQIPEQTVQTSVFFSTGRSLVEEPRVVDAADVYQATLRELLAAKPVQNSDIAIVQPVATVRSITVKDGVASVDWSRQILDFEAADQEKFLAWAAIMTTLGQFPEINKVRFTVEGKTDGTIADKDVAKFWGKIGLKNQPWDAVRPPAAPGQSEETTQTAPAVSTTATTATN